MAAMGEPLTRSRIEAFDQTAQVLSDLASLLRAGGERLRQAAAVYVEQINTPSGAEWKGQTALAAFDAASTDQQAANRAVAHATTTWPRLLRRAAIICAASVPRR
jgi:hypothetical protein